MLRFEPLATANVLAVHMIRTGNIQPAPSKSHIWVFLFRYIRNGILMPPLKNLWADIFTCIATDCEGGHGGRPTNLKKIMKLKKYCVTVSVLGAMVGVIGVYCYSFESLCFAYVQEKLHELNPEYQIPYQTDSGLVAVTGDDNGCVPPSNPKKDSTVHPGSHGDVAWPVVWAGLFD